MRSSSIVSSTRVALVLAGFSLFPPLLHAYPVNFAFNGTFGSIQSGSDPFMLAGKSFSISGTMDSASNIAPSLSLSVNGLSFTLNNVPVAFSPGSPGTISLSAALVVVGVSVPFSATVKLPNLTSSMPYGFGTQSIIPAGSSVSYGSGSNATTVGIASGTVTATGSAPSISVSPGSLSFSYQAGGSQPPAQSISVTSSSSLSFTVTRSVASPSGGTWLSVSPASGTTPTSLSVSVNPAGLSAGSYSGSIAISSAQAGNSPVNIPVTLTVTAAAASLSATPSALTFSFQTGGSAPPQQTLAISATAGAAVSFTASASTLSGGNWLSVSPGSGTTSANLTVSVATGALPVGAYSGTITITAAQAGNSPLSVPVTLTVTPARSLASSPGSLNFIFQTGGTQPAAQSVTISTSDSAAVPVTVAASTGSGGNWLLVTPSGGGTPLTLTVSVAPGGLASGTYNGSISVSANNVSGGPLSIPVTLTVSSSPSLLVSPASLTFFYSPGGTKPAPQNLAVTSTGPVFSFSIVTNGGTWLSATPANGNTPGSVAVAIDPSGLGLNTYHGSVTLTATGASNSPLTVPVTLTVAAASSIVAAPGSLTFAAQSGGSAPLPQTLSVTSTSPSNISAAATTSSGGNWLSVTPTSASTPASLLVSANSAGLANGTYAGSILISVAGDPSKTQTVQVTLLVGSQAILMATPSALSFTAQVGSTTPLSRAMSLSTTGPALNFRVVLSQGTWFSVKPGFGPTPANLTVVVDPTGLPEGAYSAKIAVIADGASNSPLNETVTLTVTPPPPLIIALTDAASSAPIAVVTQSPAAMALSETTASQGPGVAPGSVITIWGDNLGPEIAVPLSLTSSGSLATTLDDTTVMIDGQPAPLLMVQKNQINAITPYGVDGKASVTLQITRKGATSSVVQVAVVPAAPALFTSDMTGKGQGAILNQDTSANSSSNPADKGSIVVLWGEGSGQSNPAGVDGFITLPTVLPKPVLPVSVLIGGLPAEILYEGAAPDLVSGVLQINVRIPAGAASGNVPVVVNVGAFSSQLGVTVAVR